jgi:predicted kinase
MEQENVVYVLIGQRGSGKSTYAKRLKESDPALLVVSRDEILIREFGSEHGDYGDGRFKYAQESLFQQLWQQLMSNSGQRIIVDTWTGDSIDRIMLVSRLKDYGAHRVIALYLVTPVEVVSEWFWKKPGVAKISEMKIRKDEKLAFFPDRAPAEDYKVFHEYASLIENNGFDEVIRIDPREKLIELT